MSVATEIPVRHQRAGGQVAVSFKRRLGSSVLDRLAQEGCLKLRFPRASCPSWPEAVLLNSSGGVAGGDHLRTEVTTAAGTRATLSTQAAERHYRALPGLVSHLDTRLVVGAGAALEWLPQETILFDGCALRRRLVIDLAADAHFVGVEGLLFGRTAMGESVNGAKLHDLIEVRREGRLLLHDRIRFDGTVAPLLARRAIGAGSTAVATLIHAAADAARLLEELRAALAPFEAGASEVADGLLVARVVAENGACLRRAVVAGLAVLRAGRPLPRVWMC